MAAADCALEKINEKFDRLIFEKTVKQAIPKYIVAASKSGLMSCVNLGQHDHNKKIIEDVEGQPVSSPKDMAVPQTGRYRVRQPFFMPKLGEQEERKKDVQKRSRRGSFYSEISGTPRKTNQDQNTFSKAFKKAIMKKIEKEVQQEVPLKSEELPTDEKEIEVDKRIQKIRQIRRQLELEAQEENKKRGSLQKLAKQLQETQVTEKQTKRPSDSFTGITTDFQGMPMLSVFPKNVDKIKKAAVVPTFLFTEPTDQLLQQNLPKKKETKQTSPNQSMLSSSHPAPKAAKNEDLFKRISRDSKLQDLLVQDKHYHKDKIEAETVLQKTNQLIEPQAGVMFKSRSGVKEGGDFCTSQTLILKNLHSTSNRRLVSLQRTSFVAIPQLPLTDLQHSEKPERRRMINIEKVASRDRLTSANTSRLPCYDKIEISDVASLNEMLVEEDLPSARSHVNFSKSGQNLMQAKADLALARQKNLRTSAQPLLRQTSSMGTGYSQSRSSILRSSEQQRQRLQSGKIV